MTTKVTFNMVKRRKFLIGTGSLFAGGAAATGTGAFTQMSSGERTVKVRAADDSDGFIAIGPAGELGIEGLNTPSTGTNRIVSENEDGAVEINISGNRTDKIGVNEGSTYWWDNALEIAIHKGNDNLPGFYQEGFLVSLTESIPGVNFYTGTKGNREYGVTDKTLGGNGNDADSILVGVQVIEDELTNDQRTYKGTPTQGTAQVVAERK